MQVVEAEQLITVMEGPWSPESLIRNIVASGTQEDPFYVMDLGEVVARYHRWKELMPRVEPFYAVKCSDDKLLVSTLAALGTGFSCASKVEIELVTSIGVAPERIIFANPAKMPSHLRYASAVGVDVMTFDSESELMKIKEYMPHAQLVIRLRCDTAFAKYPLGINSGCDPVTEAPRLLKLAAELGLYMIGVSFHVGGTEAEVYARAIALSRALFHVGHNVGHKNMRLLDIGGGFPGESNSSISEVAGVINSSIEEHFPDRSVRVIAEPGRYFAAAAFTLATMVHAKRKVASKECDENGEMHTMYYINDGVYGSFNCVLSHKQYMSAEPLNDNGSPRSACSVWGPTCAGFDCVLRNTRLPALGVGDWLLFRDMGAYTRVAATQFNGFLVPTVRHVIDARLASDSECDYSQASITGHKVKASRNPSADSNGKRKMQSQTTTVTRSSKKTNTGMDILGISKNRDIPHKEHSSDHLTSFFVNRVASGCERRATSTDGEYYIDCKVYKADDARLTDSAELWKKALVRIKFQTDADSPQWRKLQELVRAADILFPDKPTFYDN